MRTIVGAMIVMVTPLDKEDKDTDLDTLFAVRIHESKIKFFRELLSLALILICFAVGFMAFGAVQYYMCSVNNPGIGIMDCFSGSGGKRK